MTMIVSYNYFRFLKLFAKISGAFDFLFVSVQSLGKGSRFVMFNELADGFNCSCSQSRRFNSSSFFLKKSC